jgi:hypothetical protein
MKETKMADKKNPPSENDQTKSAPEVLAHNAEEEEPGVCIVVLWSE